MNTNDARDHLLSAIRRRARHMGIPTLAVELPLHEANCRKRLEHGTTHQWSVADFGALMIYERDVVGTRTLVDAVIEADGRHIKAVDPTTAEASVRALARSFADELSAILARLDRDGLDGREAADTADELEALIPKAAEAVRTLRARAQQPR